MTQRQIQSIFFFVAMLIFGILSFLILKNYLIILIVALAMALLFRPLFNWIRCKWKISTGLAAFLTTMLVLFGLALPLSIFIYFLSSEIGDLYIKLQKFLETEHWRTGASSSALHWAAENLRTQIGKGKDITTLITFLSHNAVGLFSGVSDFIFQALLFFTSFYYFTKDGYSLRAKIFGISPLSDEAEERIYRNVTVTINATMRGTIIIAVIQGFLAGIGFWIFGITAPILLGIMTMFASLVPIAGTAVVLVPAIVYLFAVGSTASGIGLAIWSGIVVGLIDNILKPKLIEFKIKIHPLLILLSLLGGIDVFGFWGFIIGPLSLSIAWALAEVYRAEYHSQFTSENQVESGH